MTDKQPLEQIRSAIDHEKTMTEKIYQALSDLEAKRKTLPHVAELIFGHFNKMERHWGWLSLFIFAAGIVIGFFLGKAYQEHGWIW